MRLLTCNTALQPYTEELLYSFHARLGLHGAVVSPKSLIEALYNDRKVAASLVYPNRLNNLAETLGTTNSDYLINNHTLFPITAPFLPQKRRLACSERMKSDSGLGLHLASGYAASRVPKLIGIRFCTDCLKEQIEDYGEPYWKRIHQIIGTNVCITHGCELCMVPHTKPAQFRHTFQPAMSHLLCLPEYENVSEIDHLIVKACQQLLTTNVSSPSYAQWTNYYKHLAQSVDAVKGAYVNYEKLQNIVVRCWPHSWLKTHQLSIAGYQSNWLHCIFRKHRKSFSYLEHIVVTAALLKEKFDIIECIEIAGDQAKTFRKYDSVLSVLSKYSLSRLNKDKVAWRTLLKTHAPKIARNNSPALYTRIYRADKDWLLQINDLNKAKRESVNNRVNWCKRDFVTVKLLFLILPNIDADLSQPRATKRWLMFQLSNTSTVEKYSHKLPLTSMFLNRYAESISEYQIRRITYQLLTNRHPYIARRWYLLRASGLSEQRMTTTTRHFLEGLSEMLPSFGFNTFPLQKLNQVNKWLSLDGK